MSGDMKEVTAELISVGRAFQVTDSARALGQECVCPLWRNLKRPLGQDWSAGEVMGGKHIYGLRGHDPSFLGFILQFKNCGKYI